MSICNDRFRCRQLTRTYLCSIIELQAHEGQLSTEMFHAEHYWCRSGNVPRGTLWSKYQTRTCFAGWARGMFHVEHFLGSARKIEICSTWNTSRNLENRLACKMVVVTQNKHPSHLRPFQTRYWIATIADQASSIALYSTCYFLGSTSPLCNLKLSLRGDSRFAGGDCQDAGRGQGNWDGGLPCKA